MIAGVTFCEDSTLASHLDDSPSGRIQESGVIVDKSSKSCIIDLDDEDRGDDDAPPTQAVLKKKNDEKEGQKSQPSVEDDSTSSNDHC